MYSIDNYLPWKKVSQVMMLKAQAAIFDVEMSNKSNFNFISQTYAFEIL